MKMAVIQLRIVAVRMMRSGSSVSRNRESHHSLYVGSGWVCSGLARPPQTESHRSPFCLLRWRGGLPRHQIDPPIFPQRHNIQSTGMHAVCMHKNRTAPESCERSAVIRKCWRHIHKKRRKTSAEKLHIQPFILLFIFKSQ